MKSSKTFRTLCLAVACAAFAFSPAVCAQAQAVDFLANFNGVNGNSPNAVIQATDGNFYGTAYFGGAYGQGEGLSGSPNNMAGLLGGSFTVSGTGGFTSAYGPWSNPTSGTANPIPAVEPVTTATLDLSPKSIA